MVEEKISGIKYDLLLIDGPSACRDGFVKYWKLFDPSVPWIFDDVNRDRDLRVMQGVSVRRDKPYEIYGPGVRKRQHFGVMLP